MSIDRFKQFFPVLGILMVLAMPGAQAAAINWAAVGSWVLIWLRSLALYLILGLLAIWLIPKLLNRWVAVARRSPVKSFGTGIVILIAGYAALVILLILILALGIFLYSFHFSNLGSIILSLGLPATGMAFGVFNLAVAYASKLVIIFLIGSLLLESVYPKALKHNFWSLLIGLVIYLLLRAIPWLGWVIGSVVTLLGLGAIGLSLLTRTAAQPVVETVPPEEPVTQVTVPEQIEATNAPTSVLESADIQDQAVVDAPVTTSDNPSDEVKPAEIIAEDAGSPKEDA